MLLLEILPQDASTRNNIRTANFSFILGMYSWLPQHNHLLYSFVKWYPKAYFLWYVWEFFVDLC